LAPAIEQRAGGAGFVRSVPAAPAFGLLRDRGPPAYAAARPHSPRDVGGTDRDPRGSVSSTPFLQELDDVVEFSADLHQHSSQAREELDNVIQARALASPQHAVMIAPSRSER
ncbi:MAG: hypothetical protein ACRDPV_02985, partial [Gaiellaceae bacterium]